jgi:hydrogenase maturation protein HypF
MVNEVSYEAQAAIMLEMQAPDRYVKAKIATYPYVFEEKQGATTVRLGGLFQTLADDVRNQVDVSVISLRLHQTIAKITVEMCGRISKKTGLKQVALSGGVFQNRLLLKLTTTGLKEAGFEVFTHHLVPCNDGGLSLGQAVIANYYKE